MNNVNIWTGIGSRNLVWHEVDKRPEIIWHYQEVARFLNHITFRSGGARGADEVFESLHEGPKEIYLPWKKFNGHQSDLFVITPEALVLAKYYHPAPQHLNDAALKLMARNCYQVLGQDLNTPTDLIVCWTPDEIQGGTSQALRIAKEYKIPVFNIFHPQKWDELKEFLS